MQASDDIKREDKLLNGAIVKGENGMNANITTMPLQTSMD